ncbi:MAG: crotonase/enoyl-CoA hydratase family protein [Desulfobacterales bacterium]|nr:MAG: crotonase/enoyl-CoA hydratase family protein [Desulfobacterales bacterium]
MSVHIQKDGPVTIITLRRPEVRNAVDRQTAQKLADAFRTFEADREAAVAVLTGDQGQFCAGADLKKIAAGDLNRAEPDGDGPMGPTRMKLTKPVIAAIAGYAVAGGLELALWCDLRVMEVDAVLGVFSRRWGVPLIDGGTVRLPRLIGLSRALDLILTGRPVGAAEALQMGLANRVVPKGKANDIALELAHQIAVFPQSCLQGDRMSAIEQFDLAFEDAMANEFKHGLPAMQREAVAGAARFAKGSGRHGRFETPDD